MNIVVNKFGLRGEFNWKVNGTKKAETEVGKLLVTYAMPRKIGGNADEISRKIERKLQQANGFVRFPIITAF